MPAHYLSVQNADNTFDFKYTHRDSLMFLYESILPTLAQLPTDI